MGILAGIMVPHPPMIVPEVGRGSEKKITETTAAYEKAAKLIGELKPEVMVILSPHSITYSDYFHISPGEEARGDFGRFGAPEISFREQYDTELAVVIEGLAEKEHFPAGTMGQRDALLDHGTMVPLYFLRKYYSGGKILRIGLSGLPLTEHYHFGMLIRSAIEALGRRAVVVASGDLSHKLQDYGPYGFDPAGPVYDRRIMEDAGRGDFGAFFDYDEAFLSGAAECGHRSFVIMAGILDGLQVEAEALSHQDVTGVGYGVCTFQVHGTAPDVPGAGNTQAPSSGNMESSPLHEDRRFLKIYEARKRKEYAEKLLDADPYVVLARETIRRHLEGLPAPSDPEKLIRDFGEILRSEVGGEDESFLLEGQVGGEEHSPSENQSGENNAPSEDLLSAKLNQLRDSLEILNREMAGVFVSIHENGELRGCIGTILPTTKSIYEEILQNAVSASSKDPRFSPIRPGEFPYLEVHVDVLFAPEPISSAAELDVKKYGVIVSSRGRRGLLLPDLEGVDTVADQIAIARQKAGIGPEESISLQRFTVTRHQ